MGFQEARETFCPSRVARKYVRVEHRPSVVPDTPLFAALKANLANNRLISNAAAVQAEQLQQQQQDGGHTEAVVLANGNAREQSTSYADEPSETDSAVVVLPAITVDRHDFDECSDNDVLL